MPATKAVPQRDIRELQNRDSSSDINQRGNEHWHLDDPHNKALAALVYTSFFKGAWNIVERSRDSLFALLRLSNRRALSERTTGVTGM